MTGNRRMIVLSIVLAACLALSLAPSSFASPAAPSFDALLRAAARQYQNKLTLQGVQPETLAAASGMRVIAGGLNNPRGLAIGPDGGLYVAEGGTGGPNCTELEPGNPASAICVGDTGSVTRIENGVQERIATGLPSLAGPDGSAASGPMRISWRPRMAFSVIMGLGADPDYRDALAALDPRIGNLGKLVRMNPSGGWSYLADVAGYERQANPDGGEYDSNPYAVYSTADNKRIVADAGGNDLLQVSSDGRVSTVAVFPERIVPVPAFFGGGQMPMQSVPTSVAQGPDGAYYVGELTGFPFPTGAARIYRVIPGSRPQIFADGFSFIHDLAFGPDGSLYVLQFSDDLLACEVFDNCDPSGSLIRVAPDGARTVLARQLPLPGGVAVSKSGQIYVSLLSILPGMGMVVQVTP